jgi:ATP-dependent RNA helicase DDX35
MSKFLRPGERRPAAFGVSFETDRDPTGAPPPQLYNRNERLGIADQRRALPIYEHRTQILYLLEHHATTIIVGETGSGKTTQVPQYLYEAGWTSNGNGSIACTQPRRVAAMTVAARVAEEMGCTVGQEVGYAVRFEDVSTPEITKIKFCTDGVLLREMMSDPLLTRYSVVMVDEAHERSLTTDVLLGLLKKVQRRRPDLRVIVASATIQAEKVADFFDTSASNSRKPSVVNQQEGQPLVSVKPALLSVEGRPHSVQVHYLAEPTSDYVRAAVEAAVNIHIEDLPGDILIFLTGQEECERAASWLREEERNLAAAFKEQRNRYSSQEYHGSSRKKLVPCTLYAGLPAAAQLAAFEPAGRNTRKVVIATNIAETSVTIEGIVYIIDSMFSKQRCHDPLTGLESLLVAPISKASAAQRAGRAGRVRPGHAFRLCTEEDFANKLQDVEVPEMQRSSLTGTVLQLKSLGIDNMMTFHWLAPPPAEAMVRALETLHALGAIGDDAKLTSPLGVRMAKLPLEPPLAKALLAGAEAGCVEEAATIVAMLSVQSVWAPHGDRSVLDAAKSRFAVGQGDLLTYLNIWQGWEESGRNKKWSYTNFVSHRSMLRVADVRNQLLSHLRRSGLPLRGPALVPGMGMEAKTQVLQRLLKSLTSGLFINAARLKEEMNVNIINPEDTGVGVYRLVRAGAGSPAATVKLRIHPSSILFRCKPQWVCFVSAQQNDSGWYEMQELVAIESEWLSEVAPHFFATVAVNPQIRR